MGFYIRKAFRVGPFRLNLSKSGLGLSTGIPGFRIGTGPRGHYIHAGKGGLYYRKFFRNSGAAAGSAAPMTEASDTAAAGPRLRADGVPADDLRVMELRDSANASLLEELNEKAKAARWWPWLAVLAVASAAMCLFSLWFLPVLAAQALAFPWIRRRDLERTVTTLIYDMEKDMEAVYGNLGGMFDSWSSYQVFESSPRPMIPPRVATNVRPYRMTYGERELYFFPDQVFVRNREGYGAIRYCGVNGALKAEWRSCPGEGFDVPPGAKVTGETYEHTRKDGTPDKRYKANRKIYRYESGMVVLSTDGIGELAAVVISRFDAGIEMPAILARLGELSEGRARE